MTNKVACKTKATGAKRLRVRIIKPPLVDSRELRWLLGQRTKAVIL